MLIPLIINSLFIFGLKYSTQPSEILGNLGLYASTLPNWISKPLLGCLMCMSSIWGLVFFVATKGVLHTYDYGVITLVYIIALCGFNWIAGTIFNVLQDYGQKLLNDNSSKF